MPSYVTKSELAEVKKALNARMDGLVARLNTLESEIATVDPDPAMKANSNALVPSQAAIKTAIKNATT